MAYKLDEVFAIWAVLALKPVLDRAFASAVLTDLRVPPNVSRKVSAITAANP